MGGGKNVFDNITSDDLVIAFFPCTYFSDMSGILHTWGAYPRMDVKSATDKILERSKKRQYFYETVIKMLALAKQRGIRLIMENPKGKQSYLNSYFVTKPAIIDNDRTIRGDIFRKPTSYWFINCEPTHLRTIKRIHNPIRVKKDVKTQIERSIISQEYARNFICDFILGKPREHTQLSLF